MELAALLMIPIFFILSLVGGLIKLIIKLRWTIVVILGLLIIARYLKVI